MIERLIAYFHASRFQYLALEYGECSLRLARNHQPDVGSAGETHRTEVEASSVGFVDLAAGREKFPQAGATAAEGEPLFSIRKWKSTIEVRAGSAGVIESVAVSRGEFVEYAQLLATIKTVEDL
jgi:biotin carboxyl carrier protein